MNTVSGDATEEEARRLRHALLGQELRNFEEEHGAFSAGELAEAHERISAAFGRGSGGTRPERTSRDR
ncbi:hypothetical protein ACWD33_07065 [Streptomyces xiamenensis]|uniref:Uncharacterized protein n=1 Tax=Streptomyces xiamenensis TaxID=408015 RepID=A0A0F7FT39_9ACTN|nr:hypothetical protein [Streptomyces xiamenensis]AKG42807.1 hypothetical protein SXIM_14230 [Streptomyces xiamenensis]